MRFGWVKHEYFAGYARLDLAGDLSPKLIATSDEYYHRSNSCFIYELGSTDIYLNKFMQPEIIVLAS